MCAVRGEILMNFWIFRLKIEVLKLESGSGDDGEANFAGKDEKLNFWAFSEEGRELNGGAVDLSVDLAQKKSTKNFLLREEGKGKIHFFGGWKKSFPESGLQSSFRFSEKL